jgi:hypothetical protein
MLTRRIALALFLLLPMGLSADIIVAQADWQSSRSTPLSSGLVGSGRWAPGAEGGFLLEWDISWNAVTQLWTYKYSWSDADGAVLHPELSHAIIQVSPGFTTNDFTVVSADDAELGTFGQGNSNPGIPGDIFGIKFEGLAGVEFTTNRAPVWGDFYAKDGLADDFVYNAGFGTAPTEATLLNFIARPDTRGGPPEEVIPEPASIFLFGTVLAGVVYRMRKRQAA